MYPIIVNDGETPIPLDGTFFLLAGNGIFLHKDTGVLSGSVKVKTVSFLDDYDCKEDISFRLRKIPGDLVAKIKHFFTEVVAKYESESCVLLYYSKPIDRYLVVIPAQNVSKISVIYQRPALSDLGALIPVGTIHSHCDFEAFHSGTDVGDEKSFDGVHVTFGHNHQDNFSITASLVMNGKRREIHPTDLLEGVEPLAAGFFTLQEKAMLSEDDLELAMQRVGESLTKSKQVEINPFVIEEKSHASQS